MQKCPICDKGILKKGKIKESMFGVYLGDFPAEICSECGESFTDSETTKKIEEIAEMMNYGIMMTPALVVNEKVKSYGIIPKEEQILTWLNEGIN